MEQRSNYAAAKDAQIKSPREECASSTVQSAKDAAVMDAPIKQSKEVCARSMEQRGNDAALEDVQIKLRGEDCVGGTGRKSGSNCAVVKGAQI